MPLEQQVCSLELAKRLKELGVKQESYFRYFYNNEDETKLGPPQYFVKGVGIYEDIFSAFTVAELGEMLPHHFASYWIDAKQKYWACCYHGLDTASEIKKVVDADTEADARAKMLIHLIEQGLVKP